MRAPPPHHLSLFSVLLFVGSFVVLQQPLKGSVSASASATIQDLIRKEGNPRRILHQPLYPVSSTPPPAEESPPPPSPDTQAIPTPDQPFSPEVPVQATPDQPQSPPALPSPPLPANGTAASANSISQQPAKPVKGVAIAVSVGIVTLGMLSALVFFIYKHRVRHPSESRKLVGGISRRSDDESRLPSPTLLYIGTVEPSSQTPIGEDKVASGSPYRKLTSAKNSDRYRPSPELQPLPPLSKPPIPTSSSPPPTSSSDEESHETNFYTPHGSSASTDEGSYTTGSLLSYPSSNTSLAMVAQARAETQARTSPHPHSKRTSPKSRLPVSSPDTKHTTNPSVKPPLPPPAPPPPPPPPFPYSPLPSSMVRMQAVNNQPVQTSKISATPPPPPPPPPQPTPQQLGGSEASLSSIPFPDLRKLQSRISKFKANSGVEKPRPLEGETIKGVGSSSESNDPDDAEGLKPKLKPLHWDKVRATSDRATVWDQLKSSSFQLNEDMMETLFGCNSTHSVPKEPTRRSVLPPVERENRVLDPKKSQNIAILLRALNVTQDEVSEALLDGNPEGFGAELLETLVKMAPTKEEEIKLRDYKGDTSKLGSAERFLMAILDIPFAFKRVEAMLYRANFEAEVKYLRKSFETLKVASGELKNSRLFLKLLEAVLRTGNRMNIGTNRGDATAFKLETLLKLVDIKGTDGKTTLLHFVVQEIIRSEGAASDPKDENLSNKMNSIVKDEDFRKQGLQVVAGLSRELGNVKMAAGMDSDVLSSYVSKLEMGLEKVRDTLQFEKPNMQGKFFGSMKTFLKAAEEEITSVKADERKALSLVKEVTEYFHGNAAKEEAHPFRIFMIVRDFLSTLDHVCKEVGKMKDTTMVGSARSFRIPATASLPVLNRYNVRRDSSDEESSST